MNLRRGRHRARPRRSLVGLLVMALLIGAGFAAPVALASRSDAADDLRHQITGRWASDVPDQVASGQVVTAEWRVNVNDVAAAPANEPVDNVTFEVTLQHGTFGEIPDVCLTKDMSPVSALSDDETTLTCNLGTHKQGTAVVVQTAVVAGLDGGRG
jgi:hypothetical protein